MRALPRAAALTALLLGACKGGQSSSAPSATVAIAAPSASAGPSVPPPRVAAPAPSAPGSDVGARVLAPAKVCRAIQVKGRVIDDGGHTLQTAAVLDHPAWLDLDPGARLAVENTTTTRELVFLGPGRVYPCIAGEERFAVVRGGVRTTATAGARPGAEVLVATPHGVVRYGDARLDIKVERGAIAIRAEMGDAWLETPNADGTGISEEKIAAGKRIERKGLTVDVKALVGTCEATAEVAEARARSVLNPGPSDQATPLGTRAADHMRARRAARFACALAGAALGTLENGGDRDVFDQALGRAEARFRGAPSKASDTEKSESR